MTHTEYMESIGQLTIFDLITAHEPIVDRLDRFVDRLKVGDDVTIILPDENLHSEAYNYLYYYHPQWIGKAGRIVNLEGNSYQVYVNGEYLWLSEYELCPH